jgi:DNA processing protein
VPKREQASLFTPAPLPTAALEDRERLACLRLIRSDNVGPVTFRELINHYGGATAALAALPDLSRRARGRRATRICPAQEAEAELEAARRAGASPVFTIEPGYPAPLAAADAPPPMLYVKGDAGLLSRPALAIVGSRQASAAGTKLARHFAVELGRAGLVIVSGLARGIDATAHEASLDTGTVAVLAGGIDVAYPPENAGLQGLIADKGCLVTEQPPGFEPRAKDFPRRNRLISGISLGVLVVEAARKSGTLVTARFAAEQGREVFAVPGHPLDPRAEGTNQLLRAGATLAVAPSDVLASLAPVAKLATSAFREPPPAPLITVAAPPTAPPQVTNGDRDRVLAALGPHPVDADELVRATGLGPREVRIVLLELDLAGCIERHGAQLVSRRDPGGEGPPGG